MEGTRSCRARVPRVRRVAGAMGEPRTGPRAATVRDRHSSGCRREVAFDTPHQRSASAERSGERRPERWRTITCGGHPSHGPERQMPARRRELDLENVTTRHCRSVRAAAAVQTRLRARVPLPAVTTIPLATFDTDRRSCELFDELRRTRHHRKHEQRETHRTEPAHQERYAKGAMARRHGIYTIVLPLRPWFNSRVTLRPTTSHPTNR